MNAITPRHYRFGRYDRITIGNAHYQCVEKTGDTHLLQLVSGNVLQDHFDRVSDAQISDHMRRGNFRLDEAYFSKASNELRIRHDDSELMTLSEEQLRDIDWKVEWCKRFDLARIDPNYAIKVNLTKEALETFIGFERHRMDEWYRRKYGERRKPGRKVVPKDAERPTGQVEKQPKEFDYPSASCLRSWITTFRKAGYRREAFRPRYENCGRREQLHPELESVLNRCVEGYKDSRRPTGADIYEKIEIALDDLGRKRPGQPELKVSRTTVYNRIARLNPYEVELAREGADRTVRRYAMLGIGNGATVPLERVEMDDWEVDLFVLLSQGPAWKKMSKAEKAKVPRVRCTITVAIDCATRCIVGLNISQDAPSTAGARATIHSILNDKGNMARFAGAQSDWNMSGRPDVLATDGGPVFKNEEVDHTLAHCGIDRMLPEQDPRKRGTIEAFFRNFKRLCRKFGGQTFANVVERGDYPSEQMASVTFEAFYKAVTRYIVDRYHHTPHRGLEGSTPYATWNRLVAETDMAVPPSSAQQLVAFGFKQKARVTLDKHGLQFMGLSYTCAGAGALMQQAGYGAKFPIIINPHDIGSILVPIPKAFRAAVAEADPQHVHGEFLEVPCAIALPRPLPLVQKLLASEAVRRLAEQDAAAGKPFRLAASRALFEQGEQALRDAGVPDHQLTQAIIDRIVEQIDWLSEAGRGSVKYASEPVKPAEGQFAQKAASVTRTRNKTKTEVRDAVEKLNRSPLSKPPRTEAPPSQSAKPFSRSANLGDDDE